MTKEEAHIKWQEIHKNCKTVAELVEMTTTDEYKELVKILFENEEQNK